jgi:hypothetical protein
VQPSHYYKVATTINMSGADDGPPAKRLKDAGVEDAPVEESLSKEDLKAQIAKLKEKRDLRALIAEANAKVAAKDATIAELKAEQEATNAYRKRSSLLTLLDLNEANFMLQRVGSESSHVKGNHMDASAIQSAFKMFDINEEKKVKSISRTLLRLLDQSDQDYSLPWTFKRLPFATEADIASIVNDVLLDAIEILKILKIHIGDLNVYRERSLFSGRPDILVVRSPTNHFPLLVVTIQKPVMTGSLCAEAEALGQAYDYAESLRAFGHQLPVVVLTSLEDSFVCWNSKNKEATELYAKGVGSVIPCPPTSQNQRESLASKSASPPMLKTSSVSMDERDAIVHSVFVAEPDRELNRSKVFKAHELVHVLCTALCHAANAHSTPAAMPFINLLKPGSTCYFPNALRFTATKEKNYTWGELTVCFGEPIRRQPLKSKKLHRNAKPIDRSDTQAYYLIGKLGHGATSNVWHALNWEGNEVVIKMYVKTTNAEGDKEAERAAKTEVCRLCSFYPFLARKVSGVKLSGFHCVVMPFFNPVPSAERNGALKAVEEVLKTAFVKAKLKYDDNDFRWSHIGTYTEPGQDEKEIILYDLADLVSTEEEDGDDDDDGDDESFVQAHLSVLKKRIKGEPVAKKESFTNEESPEDKEEARKDTSERALSL